MTLDDVLRTRLAIDSSTISPLRDSKRIRNDGLRLMFGRSPRRPERPLMAACCPMRIACFVRCLLVARAIHQREIAGVTKIDKLFGRIGQLGGRYDRIGK